MVSMTGRRLPTPRPGTQVIPTGWARGHKPAVDATMTATVDVAHPGGGTDPGTFDPTTGTYPGGVTPGFPHWTGPARVQKLAAATTPESGEETLILADYLVVLPNGDAPETVTGDVITITNAGTEGDPTLTSIRLVVADIARGSIVWERDFRCTEDQS